MRSLTMRGVLALCGCALAFAAQPLTREQVYRDIGYLSLSDGTRLAYVRYAPAKEGRYPVLFIYEPYWGGGTALNDEELDYVNHGYAVLGVNIRGTGCSEGAYDRFSAQEEKDGAEVVEWAAAQPWSTGRVGMFGNSYPGLVQIRIAALNPPHLRAIAAGGLSSCEYEDVGYPGGIFNANYRAQWAFFTQPGVAMVGVKLRLAAGDRQCEAHRAAQPPSRAYYQMQEHPLKDEFWRSRAMENSADRIRIPALVIGGFQDQQVSVRGNVRLWERVRGPRKLYLTNGRHEVYKFPLLRAERIRWFDRWLKDEQNGIDKEPPVTVWFETRTEGTHGTPAWKVDLPGWPPPQTRWTTYHLAADRTLSPTPARGAPQAGTSRYFYPAGTEIVYTNEVFRMAPAPTGWVAYRTAPARADMAIVGSPVATLWMSSERTDTDVMVVLYDVDPGGNTTYLQRGFLRASHRALDPAKSTPHDPYHPHDREQPLTPGEVHEMKIALYPMAHVLRAGHSLQFGVMAPPVIPRPNWGLAIAMLPGFNTLHHSARYPSRLELPVLPGMKAQSPAPRCGEIEMQPCRPGQ